MTNFANVLHLYAIKLIVPNKLPCKCLSECLFSCGLCIYYLVCLLKSLNRIKGGWGWRLSLGLAGIPAILLTIGSLIVFDTPISLIGRGKLEEGERVLMKIRGTDDVELEFEELLEASIVAKEVKDPFRNLIMKKNRPQLVVAVALQVT